MARTHATAEALTTFKRAPRLPRRSIETARRQLIIALDGASLVRAQALVEELQSEVVNFEVGMELFTACGPAAVQMIRDRGAHPFLDLKYHDIPSTVAKAVAAAARLGVMAVNVHAAGGSHMLKEVRAAVRHLGLGKKAPKLIAVTVLTSMETMADIGIQFEVRSQVVHLAKLAKSCGMDGVLASPLEIQPIRQACGPDFLILTSGIRPIGSLPHDQRRIGGPAQAIRAGADYLVVGRPVTEARDPLQAVRGILEEMR
ncbi:MAG: orotidine-5'-phosphate decarboxylase [Deltaproteobacteria bacterium]|nr:orotidine-5'-phosphate decarboxylase [Deltaproteobacteria bacterium]